MDLGRERSGQVAIIHQCGLSKANALPVKCAGRAAKQLDGLQVPIHEPAGPDATRPRERPRRLNSDEDSTTTRSRQPHPNNWGLRLRTDACRQRGEHLFYSDTSAALTVLKRAEATAFLNEVSCVPPQQALRHLDQAFKNFFEGRAKYSPLGFFASQRYFWLCAPRSS